MVVSPPKAKLSKSASFSGAISRPGAATKRPVPAKPRQSLKRVLTNEKERDRRSVSHGRGRSISLMRSATAPIVPGLKREASEAPSLSTIPAADSQPPLKANRPGVLNSKRFSQREVDLSSLAPDVNPKVKKQLNIEAELKEAISALKKPNRELAGKDIVESAAKRTASASHSRSQFHPFISRLQLTFARIQEACQKSILSRSTDISYTENESSKRRVLPASTSNLV
jgi:DNA replication regulator SLD3